MNSFFGGKVFSNVFKPKPETLRLFKLQRIEPIFLYLMSVVKILLQYVITGISLYVKSTRLVIRMNYLMLVACPARLQNTLPPLTCFVFLAFPNG